MEEEKPLLAAILDGQRRALHGVPPAGVHALTVAVKKAFGLGTGAVLTFSVSSVKQNRINPGEKSSARRCV